MSGNNPSEILPNCLSLLKICNKDIESCLGCLSYFYIKFLPFAFEKGEISVRVFAEFIETNLCESI